MAEVIKLKIKTDVDKQWKPHTVVGHRFGRTRKNNPSSNYNYTILQKDIENAMKHEKIALYF